MAKRKTKPKTDKTAAAEQQRAIYAWSRKNFSAADLQKFTVAEKGVPAEKVLQEMKEIHKKLSKKRAWHAADQQR